MRRREFSSQTRREHCLNVRWQLVIPHAEGKRGEVPERSEEMRKRLEFLKQTPTYTINSNKGLVLATYTYLKQ